MNNRIIFLTLIAFLLVGCVQEESAKIIHIENVTNTTNNSISKVSVINMPFINTNNSRDVMLDVVIMVDDNSKYNITDAEIKKVFENASSMLYNRTSHWMKLQDIYHVKVNMTSSLSELSKAYANSHLKNPPEAIILLSNISFASGPVYYGQRTIICNSTIGCIYQSGLNSRLYAQGKNITIGNGTKELHCNEFYLVANRQKTTVYTAVVDWNMKLTSCISVSGKQVCLNHQNALTLPYANKVVRISGTMIHNLLKSYNADFSNIGIKPEGSSGQSLEFGAPGCYSKGKSYASEDMVGRLMAYQSAYGLCDLAYDNFRDGLKGCKTIAKNPEKMI